MNPSKPLPSRGDRVRLTALSCSRPAQWLGQALRALLLVALFGALPLSAQTLSSSPLSLRARLGYQIGGNTPRPLPAEIRQIEHFTPLGGLSLGLEARYALSAQWALSSGLNFSLRGAETIARVKAYHTTIVRSGDQLTGYFTGRNRSLMRNATFALPLLLTWQGHPRWTISAGPYAEWHSYKRFSGLVADGYLRLNEPTGEKIEIGPEADNSPSFDFSSSLRSLGWGLQLQADYALSPRLSALAALQWGLSSTLRSDFETIRFGLYPTFATFGLAYRLR